MEEHRIPVRLVARPPFVEDIVGADENCVRRSVRHKLNCNPSVVVGRSVVVALVADEMVEERRALSPFGERPQIMPNETCLRQIDTSPPQKFVDREVGSFQSLRVHVARVHLHCPTLLSEVGRQVALSACACRSSV